MNTKSFGIRRSFLVMSAGVVFFSSGERCLSQSEEQKEKELPRVQILLGAEKLDVVSPALKEQESGPTEQPMLPPGTESLADLNSPDNLGLGRRNLEPPSRRIAQRPSAKTEFFREQISQQIDFLAQQGNDFQQLKEFVERLQFALENSEQRTTRDVEVAAFAVPDAAQRGPEVHQHAVHQHAGPPRAGISFTGPPPAGPPGFSPPGLRMGGRAALHQGEGHQMNHPAVQSPEGPFAEDRRRIAALKESAERIAQTGLPDVAHGLRERAGQLEQELAEKQERMQQEERQRAEAKMRERQAQAHHQPQRLMEQRREGIERGEIPATPLRELHEQMEQLRRDIHNLSEQMAELTRLIQQHHHPSNDRGRHVDMDDEDDGNEMDEDADDCKERGEHEEE